MPVIEIAALSERVAEGASLVGLDLGTKTIGVAVSDPEWRFAHPRPVIARRKFRDDRAALEAILDGERAGGIVLGLPLHMDGTLSPRAQASKAFARNFLAARDVPLAFWDERLSTVAAERAMLEMDVSRAKRAARIDSAAAAFILQGALDRLAALGSAVSG